jgi:hypothetical protein
MKKKLPVFKVLVHDCNRNKISFQNWFEFGAWSIIKKELLLIKKQLTNASNYSKYQDDDVIITNIKKVLDKHSVDYSKMNKLFKQHAYRDIAFEAYEQILDRECMYYYWSKCEWEVIVSEWPPRDGSDKKIDVYYQLKANWEQFKNIVIEDLGYATGRY